MKVISRAGFIATLLFPLLTGCAVNKVLVVARSDSGCVPSPTNTLAIAQHPTPVAGDYELQEALGIELKRRGFQIVAATNADFVVAYWIEDDWRTVKSLEGSPFPGSPFAAYSAPGYNAAGYVPVRPSFYPDRPYGYTGRVVERPIKSQGIHLQLYTRDDLQAGRLQRAWEGFIDAGREATPEREPLLLRALVSFFGKDHVGKIKLDEP